MRGIARAPVRTGRALRTLSPAAGDAHAGRHGFGGARIPPRRGTYLVRQRGGEGLQLGGLVAVQDDAVLLPGGLELPLDHELGGDGVDLRLREVEALGERLPGDGLVVLPVGEEEGAQRLHADPLPEHLAHLLRGALAGQQPPDLEAEHEPLAALVVAPSEALGRLDHVVPVRLRRPEEDLVVPLLQEVHERPLLEAARAGAAAARGERHVHDHGRHERDALEEVQVDVHVEGHLAAQLRLLRLGVHVAPVGHALREQVLRAAGAEVLEAVLRVLEQAGAEGAQPERRHHAVEEDLRVHVALALRDGALQVRHEQQVARRVVVAAQRRVEDVAQHAARLAARVAVLVHRRAERRHELREVARRRLHARPAEPRGRVALVLPPLLALAAEAGRVQQLLLAEGLRVEHLQADAAVEVLVAVVEELHLQLREPRGRGVVPDAREVLLAERRRLEQLRLLADALRVLHHVGVRAPQGAHVALREAREERLDRPSDEERVAVHEALLERLERLRGGALALRRERHQLRHVLSAHRAEADRRVLLQKEEHARRVAVRLAPHGDGHVVVDRALRVEEGGEEVHEHRQLLPRAEAAREARQGGQLVHHAARVALLSAAQRYHLEHLAVKLRLLHVRVEGLRLALLLRRRQSERLLLRADRLLRRALLLLLLRRGRRRALQPTGAAGQALDRLVLRLRLRLGLGVVRVPHVRVRVLRGLRFGKKALR